MSLSEGKRAAALILTLVAVAGSASASTQVCSTAEVEEPFQLPDGSLHDAGTLTICLDRESSPVSFLHHAYVDRVPVGMMNSDRELVTAGAAWAHHPNVEAEAIEARRFYYSDGSYTEWSAATVRRMRIEAAGEVKSLREALTEVMCWVDNWDCKFEDDAEWPDTRERIDKALRTREASDE